MLGRGSRTTWVLSCICAPCGDHWPATSRTRWREWTKCVSRVSWRSQTSGGCQSSRAKSPRRHGVATRAPRCRYADASEASCALMRLQQSSLEAALWATARLPRPLNRVMLPSSTRSLTDLERLAVRLTRKLAHEMRSGERPSLAQERQAHRLSKMLDAVTAEAGGRVLPRLTSVSNLNAQFSTVQESRR